MNIQDRIAKLEKELAELREYVEQPTQENWSPRVGEIVEMSNNGKIWHAKRFLKFNNGDNYPCASVTDLFKYMRPLEDPMVIQLIPHVPGDPKPYGDSNNVIVVFKSGAYDAANPRDFDWDDDNDEANIVGWFDIT